MNTSGTNVAAIKNVSGQFPKYSTCVDFLKIFAFGRKDLAKQSLKSFLDSQEIFLTFWVSSSLLNQESWFPTFFSQIPLGRYVKAFSIYIKPTTYLSPSPPKNTLTYPSQLSSKTPGFPQAVTFANAFQQMWKRAQGIQALPRWALIGNPDNAATHNDPHAFLQHTGLDSRECFGGFWIEWGSCKLISQGEGLSAMLGICRCGPYQRPGQQFVTAAPSLLFASFFTHLVRAYHIQSGICWSKI